MFGSQYTIFTDSNLCRSWQFSVRKDRTMDDSLGAGFDSIRAAIMSPVNMDANNYSRIDEALTDMTSDPQDTETGSSEQSTSPETEPRPEMTGVVGSFPPSHAHFLDNFLEFSYTDDMQVTFEEAGLEWYATDTEMSDDPQTSHQFHAVTTQENSVSENAPQLYPFPQASQRPTHFALTEDIGTDYDAELIEEYDSPLQPSQPSNEFADDYDPDGTADFYLGDGLQDLGMHDRYDHTVTREFDSPSRQDDDAHEQPRRLIYDPLASTASRHEGAFGSENDPRDPHLDTPIHGSTFERNLTIEQFIREWSVRSRVRSPRDPLRVFLPPSVFDLPDIALWTRPSCITRPEDCYEPFYDIQQIPWRERLRVDRRDARALRDSWYTSYHNLKYTNRKDERPLPNSELYFRERAMYTKYHASIEHFQLRNLMSVTSHNTVQYSYDSKVYSTVPAYDDATCLIDLSRSLPEHGFLSSVKISTMKSNRGVTIAGGFAGEYAMHVEGTTGPASYGFVTRDFNGITNHIEIIPHRTNRSPLAVFASNDNHIRILDCETNQFIADHPFLRAINCTDTSTDGRLRVIVGDSRTAWVVEAETGRAVQPLRGHRDFGFACAWSPDMRHIATSNQDKSVNIWDSRTWRILTTINSDVAGYRSLRFSPIGGGPRTLLMCEPADRISIVNAQTFQTRQVHDFFGEIAGADYTPDGGSIWVANGDETFGGLMEFERREWGQRYGFSWKDTPRKVNGEFATYPDLPNEWLEDVRLDYDEGCVLSETERNIRFLRTFDDRSYDEFFL